MSELPPDPPPLAKRATPKTVVVRAADYDRDPEESLRRPARALFWLRVLGLFLAASSMVLPLMAAWDLRTGRWELIPIVAVGPVLFVAFTLPLWWRRPRRWHRVYALVVLCIMSSPIYTAPFAIPVLLLWLHDDTRRYYRHPSLRDSITNDPLEPIIEPAADRPDPPTALFALRWMCLIGCGACLLALPITAGAHRFDPDAGWGVLWWLGGFAAGFALFAVPLFARTPRPWVWWYGLGLLVLCSLSLYFTLLAVPILAAWLTRRPRAYFAWSPPPGAGGSISPSSPAARAEFAP